MICKMYSDFEGDHHEPNSFTIMVAIRTALVELNYFTYILEATTIKHKKMAFIRMN